MRMRHMMRAVEAEKGKAAQVVFDPETGLERRIVVAFRRFDTNKSGTIDRRCAACECTLTVPFVASRLCFCAKPPPLLPYASELHDALRIADVIMSQQQCELVLRAYAVKELSVYDFARLVGDLRIPKFSSLSVHKRLKLRTKSYLADSRYSSPCVPCAFTCSYKMSVRVAMRVQRACRESA